MILLDGNRFTFLKSCILLFGACAFALAYCNQTQARIFIADEVRFPLPIDDQIVVPPGKFIQKSLAAKYPAVLSVRVEVRNATFNDLNVYICDLSSLKNFAKRLPNNCRGVNKGRRTIQFEYQLQSSEPHFLVLDNSYALMIRKKTTVRVTAKVRLPTQSIEELRSGFLALQKMLSEAFSVPDFDMAVRPCGEQNAFSQSRGGHITLCSELFFGLLAENLKGALEAILMHEVAHTLLNLWGLPNWDNEETADELALVMLFWEGKQQGALDWIRYFSRHDSVAQAEYMLRRGDRHPLSLQRIRNIERILKNPRPVITRWNRLVYPKLSVKGLKGVIDNPGNYGDRALAREELKRRHTAN